MDEIKEITQLLTKTANLDQEARGLRKQAGELLARRFYQDPYGDNWYRDFSLDKETALYLMEIGLAHRFYLAA